MALTRTGCIRLTIAAARLDCLPFFYRGGGLDDIVLVCSIGLPTWGGCRWRLSVSNMGIGKDSVRKPRVRMRLESSLYRMDVWSGSLSYHVAIKEMATSG
jgi:hypothetical protein